MRVPLVMPPPRKSQLVLQVGSRQLVVVEKVNVMPVPRPPQVPILLGVRHVRQHLHQSVLLVPRLPIPCREPLRLARPTPTVV
jgi:hypothetical protein